MIQKLKFLLLSLSSVLMIGAPLAFSAVASAAPPPTVQNNINQDLCSGSSIDFTGKTKCDASGAETTTSSLVSEVITILSLIVGAIAVIMLIVGGFRYVTSGGKQESVTAAKNTILYAIVGLVIVALAQLVVHFVLGKVTSANP